MFRTFIFAVFMSAQAVAEYSPETLRKAQDLHFNLTATNLQDEAPYRSGVLDAVQSGNLKKAASIITHPTSGSRYFYDSVVRNVASTYNLSESSSGESNDIVALFLGITRDNENYKKFLTGNFYYSGVGPGGQIPSGVAQFQENNNNHFRDLDERTSMRDSLVRNVSGASNIGIFTRRQFALDFYRAGTNRRPVKAIVELLYLVPILSAKSLFVPDGFVRADVPRLDTAGNPDEFQTNCRGCHGWIDPISFAFGLFDFTDQTNALVRRPFYVDKINEKNFTSYIPTSDRWYLYVTDAQNEIFGFRDVPASGDVSAITFASVADGLRMANGQGVTDIARAIAESSGYARGIAARVVSYMFLKKVWSLPAMSDEDKARLATQEGFIQSLSAQLQAHGSIRSIFEDAAIQYMK